MNKVLLGGFSLIATMEVTALEWQNVPPIQGPNFGYSSSTNSYQQQEYQRQRQRQQQEYNVNSNNIKVVEIIIINMI